MPVVPPHFILRAIAPLSGVTGIRIKVEYCVLGVCAGVPIVLQTTVHAIAQNSEAHKL